MRLISLNLLAIIAGSILATRSALVNTRDYHIEGLSGVTGGWDSSGLYWACICPLPTYGTSGRSFTVVPNNGNISFSGKGWNPGSSSRTIHYTGNYNLVGDGFLSVYGWTRSAIIEYYIVDLYTQSNPASAAQLKGSVQCDGAHYDIFQTTMVNQPSIDGTQTYQQFWSVRNPPMTPGNGITTSITTSCHFNAWRSYGMTPGSQHNYQIVAIQGHFTNGSATITVS